MSNFLAVDTSSRYLTVVAKKGDRVVKNFIENCALNHSVVLMDEVDKTLSQAELSPAECDRFIAVTGPGSFTGIRIGISCVKGFASALGKRATGVTSFEMLSYNVNSDRDYLVAIDAAHGNYYACGYDKDGVCNLEPCLLSASAAEALGRPIFGFEELPFGDYTRLDPSECLCPAAEFYARRDGGVRALYVRKSQAEEERAAKLRANR